MWRPTSLVIGFLVVACVRSGGAKTLDLPANFAKEHKCARSDPEFEKCLLKGLEEIKPYLKAGILQYNIPAMEPFVIPKMDISLGNNKHMKAMVRNIRSYGGSNYKITNLNVSEDRLNYKFIVEIPLLSYQYDYDVDINIASIPIRGFGQVQGNLTDINADVKMVGVLKDDHIRFKTIDVDVEVGDNHVVFNNLYKGETVLTEATNALINANSKQLNQYLRPITNRLIAEELPKYVNMITYSFLFDDLFPPKL